MYHVGRWTMDNQGHDGYHNWTMTQAITSFFDARTAMNAMIQAAIAAKRSR